MMKERESDWNRRGLPLFRDILSFFSETTGINVLVSLCLRALPDDHPVRLALEPVFLETHV